MKRGAADTGRNSLAVRGWLAIAAAVVFTGALTACGGDDTGGNANPGDGGGDATEAAAEGGGDAPIDVKGDVKGDAPSDALSDVADVVGDSSPDVLSDASEAGDVKTDAPAPSDAGDAGDVKTDAPGDAMPDADATSVGDGGDAGDATLAPLASIPTATINLGSGNCGGTAVSTMLTITNSGTAALTVNASISGTVFSVTPSTLSVAANMTGKLTITATVPSGSTAGSALTGSLALTTNDTTHPTASIPLSVTAQGVTLAWDTGSPTKADFGVVPNNVAATAISLMLKNTGNASASVTLGTPSNGQFSLAPATATIAAGATATLTAGFTPTSLSQSLATSTITATGAICGTSVSSLAFSGQGAVGSVTGWPSAALDFGGNACGGAAAASQSFVLTNSGGLAAHITGATYAGYAGYSDDGNGKTIQPGGTLTVHITPPAIPTTSAVPGNYDATVTFATDVAGDSPHQVSLTEHALGAILAFDTTATANFGAFGNVPVGSVANQSFNIVNSGNAPATNVALTTTTPFSVATANVVSLAASATQPDTATFTPSTFGAATAQLSIAAGNLCQPAPQAIALAGIGQSGGIALSTQGFGLATNCGTTGIRSTLTITNSGNQPIHWSAALAFGTWYTIALAPAGTPGTMLGPIALNAGDHSDVFIYPAPMPQHPPTVNGVVADPSTFNDAINITTDITGDTGPHKVSLSEVPLGDILTWQPTALAFGNVPINQTTAAQNIVLTNAANAGSPNANVTLTSDDPTHFAVATATVVIPAGTTAPGDGVTFNAPAAPQAFPNNKITITTGTDVLCAPLPATTIPLTATATQAGPFVSPTAWNFGPNNSNLNNCGGPAAASRQVTVTNTGNQDFTVTGVSVDNTTYYSASFSPADGIVKANNANSVTVTITPNAIPATVPSVPDFATYSGTLTITTNANISPNTYPVTLTMGAQGVIVTNALATTSWTFPTVNKGQQSTFSLPIANAGNAQVKVTLSPLSVGSPFSLQSNPTTEALNNTPGSTLITGVFSPTVADMASIDMGTLTVAPTTGFTLCKPLPASWVTPTIQFQGSSGH